MSLKVGIVGLPNVGKSTLFNALLKKRVALSANYPFATVEPNIGVVAVPDSRLQKLAELVANENPKSEIRNPKQIQNSNDQNSNQPPIVPATVTFVDIAGLVKGASQGEGLGNQFLSHIREVDAIVHVLRDFSDENVVRAGSVDPKSDKEVVETELKLADLQVVEKLIDGQEKEAKTNGEQVEKQKLEILKQVQDDLNGGKQIGQLTINDERLTGWFSRLPLLTLKPVLYVYNVDEQELRIKNQELREENALVVSARLEEELADLTEEERIEYLRSVGLEQTGLERLIVAAYKLLGLISFLTAGPKEVRAWTVRAGTKAPQAAGVIHTDFEKNFIRAQVIEYEKLIEAGSYGEAKQKGWIRMEGKDYVIKDGDVVEFMVGQG